MNDRIKELEKQCWSHRVDGVLVDGHLHFDTQKFAELIIRHCASQVRFTDLLLCNDDSDGEILLQASVQLKRHFGVEE
jgi:hypothetical protein